MKSIKKIFMWMICIVIIMSANLVSGESKINLDESISILILNSYDDTNVWTNSIVDGIHEVFNNYDYKINWYHEYMDTKKIYRADIIKELKDYYLKKYEKTNIDLIIVSDDNGLKFLLDEKENIWKDTPVLFCGINGEYELNRNEYSGIIEDVDGISTIHAIKNLQADIQKIFIIGDKTPTFVATIEKIKETLSKEKIDDGIEYNYYAENDINKLKDYITKIEDSAAILYIGLNRDSEGKYYDYNAGLEFIKKYSKAPIYGLWSFYNSQGIVGGMITNGRDQGIDIGKKAIQWIKDREISQIGIDYSSKSYMFDYEILKKWELDISNLPANSIILNSPRSFYEKNKEILITAGIIIGLLVIIILILIYDIKRRRRMEKKLLKQEQEIKLINQELEDRVTRRTMELQMVVKELKETQSKLVEIDKMAALGELVAGVAHEINTPLGVSITAITHMEQQNKYYLDLLQTNKMTKNNLHEFFKKLEEGLQMVDYNLGRADRLVKSFKQVAVDQNQNDIQKFNIKERIEHIVRSLRHDVKKLKCKIEIEIDENLEIQTDVSAFVQIITNLIVNSLQHGIDETIKKPKITIIGKMVENQFTLEITDNGKGIKKELHKRIFEPFYTTNRNKGNTGLGLHIVYNLISQKIKGDISIQSEIGQGTKFTLQMPNLK